ncbi:MAG: glycoside hydrolase family 88 protein [Spirochaetales bacterium]|nr:glycoside hydrolase family 88 protein [Spirochaetales bacterium]
MKIDKNLPLSLRMAKSVENRYRPGMMQWHYEHGLVLFASMASADYYGNASIYPWVYSMYDPLIGKDGTIATYREGEFNLDQINAGRTLFKLADRSGEERFALAQDRLKSQLVHQPRTKSGVFWHKEIYPWQIWLDGLYMEGPFNAEYASRHGDREALDDVINQLVLTYRTLKDEKTGLLYHAYDESRGQRWSDINTGLSPHFWTRSIGWYCMAVLDVLDFTSEDHPRRAELEDIVRALAKAVIPFQDESGMWYQVPDCQDAEGNYLETSGSSMFAYMFYKGARLSILDRSFVEYGKKALDGIRRIYMSEDEDGCLHLDGICSVAGLGGNPYRDGSLKYYFCEPQKRDDFKGVGPFILALLEEEKANRA